MVTLSFVLTMEHTEVFRHHWHGGIAIWISCMEIQAGIIYVQEFGLHVFGWMECDDFHHRRFEKLCNEDCGVWFSLWRFESRRLDMLEEQVIWACMVQQMVDDDYVLFHGHGVQPQVFFWNKSKTNHMYKMSFRYVWQFAVSFLWKQHSKFQLWDVREHPLRDACVWTHFSSQGELGSK